MKDVIEYQDELTKDQYEVFSARLDKLGIRFSEKANAIYGKRDFIAMLLRMAANKTFAPTAAEALHLDLREAADDPKSVRSPSDDWFLGKLRELSPAEVEKWCSHDMEKMCAAAKKMGMLKRGGTIAFDSTNIPHYGKYLKDQTIKTKPKNGTARFFSYMVAHTTDQMGDMAVGCMRITKDNNMSSITHKMLKKLDRAGARPGLVLADRGFYSVDWINTIKRDGRKFVMPAVKNPRVKKAIREYHGGKRDAVSKFTMRNKDGAQAEFKLLIVEKDDEEKPDDIIDRYVAFATNMPRLTKEELIEEIPETYRNRWIIETGFRVIKDVLAKTCSRVFHVRLFLFHVALLLYNLWRMAKFTDITYNHGQADGKDFRMAIFAKLMKTIITRQITWQRLREDPS